MQRPLTKPLRRHHDEFRPGLEQIAETARQLPALDGEGRRAAVADVLGFLRGRLRLHAEAEEMWLYPRVALRLEHPRATAVMEFDHLLLREYDAALESADVEDVIGVQQLLFGLHALLDAHFRKEEEIYLPLLEYEDEREALALVERGMDYHERGLDSLLLARPKRIDPEMPDFPDAGRPIEKLVYLVRYAINAPSSHNSQPWLFEPSDNGLNLYADRTRVLPVVDPDGRELVMSCGAALYHLRVAISHFGYEPLVELLPDRNNRDLLARIELGSARAPTYDERLLFWAIPARRTNRHGFEKRPPPAKLLASLAEAADSEGAWLTVLERDEERSALAALVSEADRRQLQDERFRRELAAWVHGSRDHASDGMPAYALGLPRLGSLAAPFVLRTFDLGKGTAARDQKLAEGSPALLVLGTEGDGVADWLRAGQALDEVLLRAAQEGVSASFLNQPVELPDLRPRVLELTCRSGFVQLVLRLGYGPAVQPTPRRALRDVLLLDP